MEIYVLKSLMMRYGSKIGLTAAERDLIWHMLDHDFDGKGYCWPSLQRLAERCGVSSTQAIRYRLKKLEKKRVLEIERSEGFSNKYSWNGLIKKLAPYAEKEAKEFRRKSKSSPGQIGKNCDVDPSKNFEGYPPKNFEGYPPKNFDPNTLNELSNIESSENKIKESRSSDRKINKKLFLKAVDALCDVVGLDKNIAANRKKAGAAMKQFVDAGYAVMPDPALFVRLCYGSLNRDIHNQYHSAWRFANEHWVGKKNGKPTISSFLETAGKWYEDKQESAELLDHLMLTQQEIAVLTAMYGVKTAHKVIGRLDTEECVRGMRGRSHFDVVREEMHRENEKLY